MTRALAKILALLTALCALACGGVLPAPTASQPIPFREPSPGGFLVGTALADITPPLHLSLFGHGPESRVATGVRLRLHCQVFVVSTGEPARKDDGPIALVPCDLQSSSAALQRGVAALLAQYGVPITADRIFIMATHTHAGPAHYFESRFYSGPFSSSIPAYDEEVKNFLAQAVAEGIVRAFAAQGPACVGFNEVNVPGLTFNRAYVPFLANERTGSYVEPILKEAEAADRSYAQSRAAVTPWSQAAEAPSAATGAERAVDPRLFVLRFDARAPGSRTCEAQGPPLGVLAVYGMHPTGVSHENELYHGDVFGFATRVATACLRDAKHERGGPGELTFADSACDAAGGALDDRVLVGLANGVEGDVSPNVLFQSVPNARRLGRRLGLEIARAAADIQTLDATGPFEHAYWELWFPNARYDDDASHKLCPFADLGIASGGGAPDGPTRLRVLGAANPGYRLKLPPDMREEDRPCQGYKLGLRIGPSPDPEAFPRFGAISLVELGPARIATVPAEVTTVTGLRIRQALTSRLGTSSIAVVGLTNHYLQYVTTKEEYDFQYYEGASNLYGPHSAEFLVRHFDCLAGWLTRDRAGAERRTADSWLKQHCDQPLAVNRLFRFEPHPKPKASRMPPEEELALLALENPPVKLSFEDGAAGFEMEFPRLPLNFTADRGKYRAVVLSSAGTVVDDDDGSSMETQEVADGAAWRLRWVPDLEARRTLCGKTYRLVVHGRFELQSRPFELDCSLAKVGAP